VVEYRAWLRTVAEMTENNARLLAGPDGRRRLVGPEKRVRWRGRRESGLDFGLPVLGSGPRFHPGAAFGP